MANEDKAARYHRLRRQASLAGTTAAAFLLFVLVFSGAAATLRTIIEGVTGGLFVPGVDLYTAVLVVVCDLLVLPLAFYQGMTLEHHYGLSTQSAAAWFRDRARATGIAMVFLSAGALIVLSLMRWMPAYWWVTGTLIFGGLLSLLARIAPVVLMPLFYHIAPLDRPSLRERLLALAERAGVPALGVFEWRLGDRTRKANAALAGAGRTRRILLSDTLLAHHSEDEIEVIVAHELAHHVHHDMRAGLVVETAIIGAGLYAADWVMSAAAGRFGSTGKDDVALLPLGALALGAASLLLMPLAHAVSRAHERRADSYALEMTRNPGAFVSAMRRLSAQNLAEDRPPALIEWLFHSHPSTAARIAAASAWRPTGAGSDRRRSGAGRS
jgi:STE24 endopeptidase